MRFSTFINIKNPDQWRSEASAPKASVGHFLQCSLLHFRATCAISYFKVMIPDSASIPRRMIADRHFYKLFLG